MQRGRQRGHSFGVVRAETCRNRTPSQVAHARAYRIRSINMIRSWTDYRLELFPYSAENSVEFIIEPIKAR